MLSLFTFTCYLSNFNQIESFKLPFVIITNDDYNCLKFNIFNFICDKNSKTFAMLYAVCCMLSASV